MSPSNDSPRPWGTGPRRGPPPFIVQMLRAPLTLNNLVALGITKYVQYQRDLLVLEAGPASPPKDGDFSIQMIKPAAPPCSHRRFQHVFGLLSLLFIASLAHNVLTVMRFHRIRRSVFGESMCAARRRWRRGEMSQDERENCGAKMREMGKRMPSVVISSFDVVLSVGFFGAWLLTVLLVSKEGKVELGIGYASVGALVAFILNFIVGVNGLKLWARNKKQQRREAAESVEVAASEYQNEKAALLAN